MNAYALSFDAEDATLAVVAASPDCLIITYEWWRVRAGCGFSPLGRVLADLVTDSAHCLK